MMGERRVAQEALDARTADPPQHHRWRSRLLLHMVPAGHARRGPRDGRRSPMGDRGRLRNRQERTRPRPQRDPLLAWLAPPCLAGHARLRHDGGHPSSRQCCAAPKNEAPGPALIRWSVQEIRRIATRLAQRKIPPARIIAWSLWRRAHQAAAKHAHSKSKSQL